MMRLGGTIKLGEIVGEIETEHTDAAQIFHMLADRIPKRSFDFGWSVYGGTRSLQTQLEKCAIRFKKSLKVEGHSTRWVTGERNTPLSPAAVAKLDLIHTGLDICLIVENGRVAVGLTTHVQDADAWSTRDYGRPSRDEISGMLPPKLARMMVNLAQSPENGTILDPFCGNGTILMEAALATNAGMIIGSDISDKQIASCRKNLEWLIDEKILHEDDSARTKLYTSDVRRLNEYIQPSTIDRVVTEGHLGPPLHGHESKAALEENANEITRLWNDALTSLSPILKKHSRIVCIWPSFKTSNGTMRVDLTNDLPRLGYRIVDPLEGWEASGGPLLYMRPGQRVARRIVVLEKADS